MYRVLYIDLCFKCTIVIKKQDHISMIFRKIQSLESGLYTSATNICNLYNTLYLTINVKNLYKLTLRRDYPVLGQSQKEIL